jgi:hypothetical protein
MTAAALVVALSGLGIRLAGLCLPGAFSRRASSYERANNGTRVLSARDAPFIRNSSINGLDRALDADETLARFSCVAAFIFQCQSDDDLAPLRNDTIARGG